MRHVPLSLAATLLLAGCLAADPVPTTTDDGAGDVPSPAPAGTHVVGDLADLDPVVGRVLSTAQGAAVYTGFETFEPTLGITPSGAIFMSRIGSWVVRSLDGGATWEDCAEPLVALAERPHLKSKIQSDSEAEGMLDAHALLVSDAAPGTVFLAVRMGLFRSEDRGKTWADMEVGRFSPLTYGRDIRVSPQDPNVLYACLSPAARSEDGSLYRSGDLGKSWQRLDHGVKARATMMGVALHPKDSAQVYCASRCGQVFGTQDGGRTWRESPLPDGIDDVYAIACG